MLTKLALGCSGFYLTIVPVTLNTNNFKSAILFKVMPMICGIMCDVAFLIEMGYIVKM